MDRIEFVKILTPLVLAMRADFDKPTWTVYFQTLKDVPQMLLVAAVEAVKASDREFIPKPGQLLATAEQQRQALSAAHPWEPCCECETTPKWRAVLVDGVSRLQRCPCWMRHQEKLASLGVSNQPLALPAATSISEFARVESE